MARECTTLFVPIPKSTTSEEATGGANLDTMMGIAKGLHQSCNGVNRTPSHRVFFSHISTHFILAHMHSHGSRCCSACLTKTCSSTCHHVSDRALSLFALTSSFLSSASTLSLISSSPLSWSSSSMWSELPSTKSTAHPQNEEYCPVAVQNPLTNGKEHITSFGAPAVNL